jgi:hydroxylaminobenzene mutase
MSTHDRSRHILIHGLLLVMVGLLWGFAVPHTPHPRLALGAHVQFVTNGVLIIVMARCCSSSRTMSAPSPLR